MPTFAELFHKEYGWELDKTRKLLQALPDHDPDFAPHPKSMAMGRLSGHVAHLAGWPAMVIANDVMEMKPGDPGFPSLEKGGRDALLASFEKYAADSLAAIAATNDDHLASNWKFLYNGHTVIDLPRTVVLADVCRNHMIHHRGQLTVYVRLLGGKVPGLYGPSSDDREMM